MKGYRCTGIKPSGELCSRDAKWWFRDSPTAKWFPRCGNHALLRQFSRRQREPISENPPDLQPRAAIG